MANSFTVVEFETSIHSTKLNSSATNITLPSTGFYSAPVASGVKQKIPWFYITVKCNNGTPNLQSDWKAYSGHGTSSGNIASGVSNGDPYRITIPTSQVQSSISNGIITYKFTVAESRWGKAVYFTIKMEAP